MLVQQGLMWGFRIILLLELLAVPTSCLATRNASNAPIRWDVPGTQTSIRFYLGEPTPFAQGLLGSFLRRTIHTVSQAVQEKGFDCRMSDDRQDPVYFFNDRLHPTYYFNIGSLDRDAKTLTWGRTQDALTGLRQFFGRGRDRWVVSMEVFDIQSGSSVGKGALVSFVADPAMSSKYAIVL